MGLDSDRLLEVILDVRDKIQEREDRQNDKLDLIKKEITVITNIVTNTSDRVEKLENQVADHSSKIKIMEEAELSLKTVKGWKKITPYLILGIIAIIGWLQQKINLG